jgi:hypothetical protein
LTRDMHGAPPRRRSANALNQEQLCV